MQENKMKIAPFKIDVTPETGTPIAYGINKKVDTPIYIRGVVIDDGESRAVLVSCDYIYIWGETWYSWRKIIAEAAGTSADRVFLHSIHQHDSLRIAPELNEILRERFGTEQVPDKYMEATVGKLKTNISEAVKSGWLEVGKLLTAERRVKGLASNRRMIDENGKCYAMRFSMCSNEELKQQPVGVIDPLLRTIAFADNNGKLLLAAHFYASHPMGAYGREMVCADIPGFALDYVRQQSPEVNNIYFNGCGGNITFGKYSFENGDTSKEKNLAILGEHLGRAIQKNLESLEEKPLGKLSFKKVEFDFPLKPEITEAAMLEKINQAEAPGPVMTNIMRLIIVRNWAKWYIAEISRMSIGNDVHFLSIPGETCVEYQLYAQQLIPEQFLACAAYGNGTYHYIPTAPMYDEGGYEPDFGAITTPDAEVVMKTAIHEALADLQ